MRLLLVTPPCNTQFLAQLPPAGISYIASFVRQNGVEVDILDATSLGLNLQTTLERIGRAKPDVIGIPVISVNLPEVDSYNHVVRIANDYDEFDRALVEEISGRHLATPEQLDAVARGETWERKVDEISDLVTQAEDLHSNSSS